MAASVKSYDFLDPPSRSGDLGMLGHYCVISELGRGGMGFVFRAEDIKLKRTVALKVMNQKIAATPNSRRRFIHEARAMAAVHHDNVVTIFEVGESKGTPFMAMEMLSGSTIETFNRAQTRLGYEKIIEYAKQIARGLSAAHVKGIVHRDIKPANIWIQEGTDRIKILDFGLALASTPVDHLAGRGAVIGTPGYLSPEQARSEPLDDRSDLYSLGVVLYELCTGQLPIQSKSVPGQLISILAHRPKPINEINPDIPQPLCEMIHRLLRKEPRSRPSSAAKLEEELNRVEVECHAKSEVAQAINKLQMGLSEVVSKNESGGFFDTIDELQETIPDPLAVIPAPVAMIPPARPAVRNSTSASAGAPAWQAYWPFAAVGVGVLLAILGLTLALMGRGGGDDTDLVADATPSSSSSSTEPQPKPASQNQNPTAGNRQANNNEKKPDNSNQANRGKNAANKNKGAKRPAAGAQSSAGANNNSSSVNKSNPAAKNDAAKVVAKVEPPKSTPPPPSKPPIVEPKPEPSPAVIEMRTTTISTNDGRGADAMVQSGGSEKLGLNQSIGIRQRGGVETNHSYIRFDLAPIEDVKKHVRSAELILSVVGSQRPIGSVIKVIGIADVGDWPEDAIEWKYSFSKKGLDPYPLLAKVAVTRESDPRDAGRNVIRISSPELAKFIADGAGDLVTLALAGSAKGNAMLRFISREQSPEQAPSLVIEAPREPPPEEKKQRR